MILTQSAPKLHPHHQGSEPTPCVLWELRVLALGRVGWPEPWVGSEGKVRTRNKPSAMGKNKGAQCGFSKHNLVVSDELPSVSPQSKYTPFLPLPRAISEPTHGLGKDPHGPQ